jgi:hypothetical protein
LPATRTARAGSLAVDSTRVVEHATRTRRNGIAANRAVFADSMADPREMDD